MVSLELCDNLPSPPRLMEANQDLQQTRAKLSQEEFVSSELAAVQERLHSAAGQVGRRCSCSSTAATRYTQQCPDL